MNAELVINTILKIFYLKFIFKRSFPLGRSFNCSTSI